MSIQNLERRPADVVAGAIVVVLGGAYTLIALQTPPDASSASVIGPAVMPILIGLLLALGGAAVAIGGLRLRPHREETADAPQSGDRRKLWITVAMFGVYVIAFIPVGYLLSTIVFLLTITSYFSRKSWKSNLIYAILFPLIVFGIFEYLLSVPLPEGILSGVLA